MTEELYVLVCERDIINPEGGGKPIVLEQDVDDATLKAIKGRQERLGDRYGKTRIAKLEFIEG